MPNDSLSQAKNAKNDEFYTQYADIQAEINAYLEYDPEVFRGKTILLPCDDPEWSNFTKFFAQNFEYFGLKKLISTSYAVESKKIKAWEPTLFETENPHYDADKSRTNGKIFILDHDINANGKIDIEDLQWQYLDGDGDFRSDEVKKLRDEADIIVTNPPFSLFREFLAWLLEEKKKFIIIGNMNAITYKEVFPHLMNNEIWLGYKSLNLDMYFDVSDNYKQWLVENKKEGSAYKIIDGVVMGRLASACWFTNVDHGKRHEPLMLMTMADNIKFSRHKEVRGVQYSRYDNYDALEVPFADAIPSDYAGTMGVPITFFDKYCPEQFEILGITKNWFGGAIKIYPPQIQVDKHGRKSEVTKLNDGAAIETKFVVPGETFYIVNQKNYIQVYARILIRKKQGGKP